MKLVKEVRLSLPAFMLLALFPIALAGENCYLASVNVRQQHTIRQYMGLEPGPDATPQPPNKAVVPSPNCYPDYKQPDSMAVPCNPTTPPELDGSQFDRKRWINSI